MLDTENLSPAGKRLVDQLLEYPVDDWGAILCRIQDTSRLSDEEFEIFRLALGFYQQALKGKIAKDMEAAPPEYRGEYALLLQKLDERKSS